MERAHADGFFIAPLAHTATNTAGAYRIRIALYSGETLEIDDPYRFPTLLTPFELHLHGEGTNYESYRTLGAHETTCMGAGGGNTVGVRFAVWAPNASVVSIVGDFNGWDRTRNPMRLRDGGIWEIFVPALRAGAHYKYSVLDRFGHTQDKCDPYGFFAEFRPRPHRWCGLSTPTRGRTGRGWISAPRKIGLREPISVYEVHLESWLRPAARKIQRRERAR